MSNSQEQYTSSPEFHLPHLSKELGKSAVKGEVDVTDKDPYTDENGVIVRVPGIARVESVESDVIIIPQGDLGKIPGTKEYTRRQEAIANFAHSELAASNAHERS
jgi:hypothetical protein